jgi:Protein of unknown function (DUF4058)
MPSPFPGMDPYLESPGLWPDVHHQLISEFQALLVAQLRPRYYATVDIRTYVEGRLEIDEAFLKVVHRESRVVVTIIEILLPTTKLRGSPAFESFEAKKREYATLPIHRVEVDLLRGGRMVPLPEDLGPHEYLVHVSREGTRPRGELWGIRLPQRLRVIPIPLKKGDPDGRLNLQAALDSAYDRAQYDQRIDYRKEPKPPLDEKLAAWADQLLRSKGLR